MAENLISVPWRYRAAKPGFGYAGGFQDILTAYNGLSHRGADKRYHDNQALLDNQIYRLEELKGLLEQDEDKFFKLFDIYHPDKKECFRMLKQKINEWDQTGAWVLINDASMGNKFYEALKIFEKHAIFAEITEELWDEMLTYAFIEEGGETVKELLQSNQNLNIAQILNYLVAKDKSRKPFSTSSKSSLIDNLRVTLDEKGETQIVSEQGKISPALQRKVISQLEKHFKIEKPRGRNYNFKQMFSELFDGLPIDETGQRFIMQTLGDYSRILQDYAFNSSSSQIKGFLGEIYNNAFLYFMADGSKNKMQAIKAITPTGAFTTVEKNQQLVIDTWLEEYGIQVKNYEIHKVLNQGFSFKKGYNADTFITEVLQLNSRGTDNYASVGDILLNFFTAFDYNRDYSHIDSKYGQTDAYKYWVAARARMNDKAKDAKAFTNIIMPYVDKVIGIDKRFSSNDSDIFTEPKEYRNTFFNISGNYIPSSVIVQAIIDAVNKKKDSLFSEMVQADFRVVSYTKSSEEKWNPAVTDKEVANVFANREKYAASSKIDYTVNLDVTQISRYILGEI